MTKFLRRVARIRQLRKNSEKNLLLKTTKGKDEDVTNKGKRPMGSSHKSQNDRSICKRSLNDESSVTATFPSLDNSAMDHRNPVIDSRDEEVQDGNGHNSDGIREEFKNEEENSRKEILNDELSFFITDAEASVVEDESKILGVYSIDETSFDVSYGTAEKSCDEISLDTSSGGFDNITRKKVSKKNKGFLRRLKDDISQKVDNFQRHVSRRARVIIDEIHGTFLDTTSAFDQVCNAFTLQEEEINAVRTRLDKAYMHYDRRIDTLEPVMEMSSRPMSFKCRVLKIF